MFSKGSNVFKTLSILNKKVRFKDTLSDEAPSLKRAIHFLIIKQGSSLGIPEFIKNSPDFYQLTCLEVSGVAMTLNQVEILGLALQNMTRLLSLSLTNTGLFDIGAKKIMDVLSTSLVSLELSSNHIENGICFSGHQKIWQYLRNFNLSGNKINPLGLTDFLDMLSHQKTIPLMCLSLKGNQMNDHGVTRLSQHFKALTALFSLDLSDNQITDDGGITLFATLSTLQSLKKLRLKQNKINIGEMLLEKTVHEMPYLQLSIGRKRKPIKSV